MIYDIFKFDSSDKDFDYLIRKYESENKRYHTE